MWIEARRNRNHDDHYNHPESDYVYNTINLHYVYHIDELWIYSSYLWKIFDEDL